MMRTAFCCFAIALAGLTSASSAQSLSVYGTLYRATASGQVPIADAKTYLQGATQRIGPAITDSYGRFAFYDISAGRYHLVCYVQDVLKWQADITAPGRIPPIVLR